MAVSYKAVGWNRQKRIYDGVVLAGVLSYLGLFVGSGIVLDAQATLETLLIRGLGTCAFLLLTIILSIGPLARLDDRFLPLLYNRRHLGVTMSVVALAHGVLSLVQFHAFGDLNPLVSVLVSPGRWEGVAGFPFQPLGLAALVILLLMAATSHDFWLANLTAPTWKRLHMLVYVAWALLVLHVALGALYGERHPALVAVLAVAVAWVLLVHGAGALRERRLDPDSVPGARDFVRVCPVDAIPENRARIVSLSGERVALFRYDGKVSAISNVCQHQNGPLGEGCVLDGLVTCPWHGYQYRPHDGTSPPPYAEKVPTFRVRIVDGVVEVHPRPLPAGTPVEPARIPGHPPTEATP